MEEPSKFYFASGLFSISPCKDEETNSSRFGKELAGWIAKSFWCWFFHAFTWGVESRLSVPGRSMSEVPKIITMKITDY